MTFTGECDSELRIEVAGCDWKTERKVGDERTLSERCARDRNRCVRWRTRRWRNAKREEGISGLDENTENGHLSINQNRGILRRH